MFKNLTLLATLGLTACGVAPDAVLKQTEFTEGQIVATDSRLRIVNSSTIGFRSIPGEVDPHQIVCAEPSPDVAIAIANSFGGGFNVLGYGNAALSASHVEGLVQLGERTATIQLLRDKMYQSCLAYANGAISGTTYSIIMSRLDDTIVTLLMGETAGGAFGRSLASIGGKANSSASAKLSALPGDIANLDEHVSAATAAEEELRAAEKNLAEHKATQPAAGKEAEHATRTKELESEVEAAVAKRAAAQRLMKDTLEAASDSAAEISSIEGGGGLDVSPDPLIATTLADMQAEFLLSDVSTTIVTACLVELGRQMGVDRIGGAMRDALAAKLADSYESADSVEARRMTGTRLANFCERHLNNIIIATSERHKKFRTHRANLRANVDIAKFGAAYEVAKAGAIEAIAKGLKACEQLPTDEEKAACRKKVLK